MSDSNNNKASKNNDICQNMSECEINDGFKEVQQKGSKRRKNEIRKHENVKDEREHETEKDQSNKNRAEEAKFENDGNQESKSYDDEQADNSGERKILNENIFIFFSNLNYIQLTNILKDYAKDPEDVGIVKPIVAKDRKRGFFYYKPDNLVIMKKYIYEDNIQEFENDSPSEIERKDYFFETFKDINFYFYDPKRYTDNKKLFITAPQNVPNYVTVEKLDELSRIFVKFGILKENQKPTISLTKTRGRPELEKKFGNIIFPQDTPFESINAYKLFAHMMQIEYFDGKNTIVGYNLCKFDIPKQNQNNPEVKTIRNTRNTRSFRIIRTSKK